MKSVTYNDLENAAPEVESHGIVFKDGESMEVEDEIADILDGNKFFEVSGSNKKKPGRPPKLQDANKAPDVIRGEPKLDQKPDPEHPLGILAAKE